MAREKKFHRMAGFGRISISCNCRGGAKSETRNPKAEGNPKAEIRIVAEPQSAGLGRLGCREGSRKVC
jgi:hypothetical protein